MKQLILTLVILLLWAPSASSQQNGFAQSADEILNMLTDDGGRAYLKIEFDTNSAKLKDTAIPILNALGKALTAASTPEMEVKLIGHTDSAGDAKYNLRLSQQRAEAVKTYLISAYNIDPAKLTAEGMGESTPIAPNNTSAGRALNRRVEVVNVTKKARSINPTPAVGNSLFQ